MESISDVSEHLSRHYFTQLVESSNSDEQAADIMTLISSLEGIALETALPAMCLLAEKCPVHLQNQLRDITYSVIQDPLSSRSSRKACFSTLKELAVGQAVWNDFFVLAESLEEPQFHIIRPVLPRMDSLLMAVSKSTIEWKWAALVLIRGMLHSNGWIRLWALEKSVQADNKVMITSYPEFLLNSILPALNTNDLLWRLLERGRLTEFVNSLGTLMAAIVEARAMEQRGDFVRCLLSCIESMSCPLFFYYVAAALQNIPSSPLLAAEDVPLIRNVLRKVQHISYISLKLTTLYLLVKFASKMMIWNAETKLLFGSLTVCFSRDSPGLMHSLEGCLTQLWHQGPDDFQPTAIVEYLATRLHVAETSDDLSQLVWLQPREGEQSSYLLTALCLSLSDSVNEEPRWNETNALLAMLLHAPADAVVDASLMQDIVGFILLRVAMAHGTPGDFKTLTDVYLPLLTRYQPQAISKLPQAIFPRVCDEQVELSSERRALLCRVLRHLADTWSGQIIDLKTTVTTYLGYDLLAMPRTKRSISALSAKEFATITAGMTADCLDLYLRFLDSSSIDYETCMEYCIEQLDCTSAYSVKERLLRIMEIAMDKLDLETSQALLLSAVNAAAAVVNEEKKSLNCLPSIRMLFRIGLSQNALRHPQITHRMKELFAEFLTTASLSTTIPLVISNVMKEAELRLTDQWAQEVVTIALFGPVPKKENRVLRHSYEMIYSGELAAHLPSADMEKQHEVVQRARVQAICVAVNCCGRSQAFTEAVIKAILKESTALDANSSRSFGLSLAHRQKTRAVALLLFVAEYIVDKDLLSDVFVHCIECVIDPCQQFSIKLIVEWILVRLSLKHEYLREKLIGSEREFARRRIGSVSSWINTLVHLSRVERNEATFSRLIGLIVPWTTAQNFAVRCTAIAAAKMMFSTVSTEQQKKWELVRGIIEFDSEPAGNSRRIIDNLLVDFYFARLNMEVHFDLQSVLIEIPRKTGMPVEETVPITLIQELNTTCIRSINNDDHFLNAPTDVYNALGKSNNCAPDMESEETEDKSVDDASPDVSFQRKIQTKTREKRDDCSMIVVASLIDKPNNLGGLCRTSEIFGVDCLVVADMLLTNDTGFKALSMSSENWQKIEAVRPDQLLSYLESLRSQGYTVIAAEQTCDSKPMHKFEFPKKCALLMGDERQGVPTQLLRCVDQTVEIEQLGRTRSLNVHVTAALFISKYAEQVMLQQ